MKKTICPLLTLCMVILISALFTACLDIPNTPTTKGMATDVTLSIIQNSSDDSTALKINSSERAYIRVHVEPSDYEDELIYTWYKDQELIAIGSPILIENPNSSPIPNRLEVTDKEGNVLKKEFTIITNSPPRLGTTIYPKNQSVHRVTSSQPVLFKWFVTDLDDDEIESILVIDDVTYNVGNLTQVQQSGFKTGWHKFYITIVDQHGDKATSEEMTFYTDDPTEEQQ